jgi:hypothetical protein
MMKAALPGAAFGSSGEQDRALFSCSPPDKQALPPREVHDPLPEDKTVWWPSPRRPLRRDLERLISHFAGWDRR